MKKEKKKAKFIHTKIYVIEGDIEYNLHYNHNKQARKDIQIVNTTRLYCRGIVVIKIVRT